MAYTKTTWVNGTTEANESTLNNIENGIDNVHNGSIFKTINGNAIVGSGNILIKTPNDYTRTTLFSGDVGSGDISLSQSWDNFDELIFYLADDGNSATGVHRVNVNDILDASAFTGNDYVVDSYTSVYWRFDTTDKTKIDTTSENSRMRKIIGVNW